MVKLIAQITEQLSIRKRKKKSVFRALIALFHRTVWYGNKSIITYFKGMGQLPVRIY